MEKPKSRWIINAPVDLMALSWAWVPLYLVFVDFSGDPDRFPSGLSGLALSRIFVFVFSLQFAHRQYSYYVAYGDTATLRVHRQRFILAPFVLITGVSAFYLLPISQTARAVVLGAIVFWEMWHVIMQRVGLLRIYASKAGGGLESKKTALLDRALVWCGVVSTALLCYRYQSASAQAVQQGRVLFQQLQALDQSIPVIVKTSFLGIGISIVAGVVIAWCVNECRAPLLLADRVPRLTFVFSTLVLLATFVVSGPIVGFLIFTFSHAIEYLAFVHAYEYRKMRSLEAQGALFGFAAALFRRPMAGALLSAVAHVGIFEAFLSRYVDATPFLIYSGVTGLLHFLYDGWIWKIRRPAVRAPLVAA